jgi:MraZ protein
MESESNGQAPFFSSCYFHGVDEKRRVQIPIRWRPAPDVELTLLVWPKSAEGPCLRVLLPDKMAALLRFLDSMPNENPNKAILKRYIGGGSIQVTLDKVGRIILPEKMAKDVGITDQAVFVGCLDRFEIWSPERYEKVKASDAVMALEAFKMME